MSDTVIRVTGLGKRYTIGTARPAGRTLAGALTNAFRKAADDAPRETFWALRDVSFDVRRGEVVGIIGRNGAGKSTLLKVLSRITDPTEGGVDITGRIGSLLEVGTGFHPELTGRENVFLNGAILGMRRAEIAKKFDEIVEFAGTEKFLDTAVKHYSSGMYTRLAFAVAAHLEPEILIVDEVLAVGDAEFQRKCIGKMKDVAGQGRTVLFVSHNLAAVRSLCTAGVMLKGGRVVADGGIGTVIDRYLAREGSGIDGRIEFTSAVPGLALADAYFVDAGTGERVDQLSFTRDYELRLDLHAAATPVRGTAVATIADLEGNKVSTLATAEEGVPFFDLSRTAGVRFRLPDLSLAPGSYRVSVDLCDPHTLFLHAEVAAEFTVEPQCVNGAPWSYNRTHGVFRVARGASLLQA